ncbi:MAG: hypothetical protein SGARI_004463 [Bacillariaceae sp.]
MSKVGHVLPNGVAIPKGDLGWFKNLDRKSWFQRSRPSKLMRMATQFIKSLKTAIRNDPKVAEYVVRYIVVDLYCGRVVSIGSRESSTCAFTISRKIDP